MFRAIKSRVKWPTLSSLIPFVMVLIASFIVFLWHLGRLLPGLSVNEYQAKIDSQNLRTIYENPINAPHKLVQHLLTTILHTSPASLRLSSVVFGIFFCFCFYKLLSNWFGRLVGIFGTLIISSLPIVVIYTRQASADILLLSPIVFMWLYAWLLKTDRHKHWAWLSLLASFSIFIFSPGILWWIVGASILTRKKIISIVSEVSPWISLLGSLLIAASLAVLGYGIYRHHTVIKNLLLIPLHLSSPLAILKNLGWMIFSLFVKTGTDTGLVLGRLPVFNILLLSLIVFGVYAMWAAARSKTLILGLPVIFGVLVAGFNNNFSFLIFCVPAAAVFISAGLRYLYIEWRVIFPRNPVPKSFALVLIALVTLTQLYYGLRYSLVAWPNAASTKSTYVLK